MSKRRANRHMEPTRREPHDPRLADSPPRVIEELRPPIDPPAKLGGSYLRCGGCDDYLSDASSCERCGPVMVPEMKANTNAPAAARQVAFDPYDPTA